MRRILGLKDLAHDAIDKVITLVEDQHQSVAQKPFNILSALSSQVPEGESFARAADVAKVAQQGGTALIYAAIRATNEGVRAVEDAGIELVRAVAPELTPGSPPGGLGSRGPGTPSFYLDHAQGALNAAFGDFLEERGNPLGIRMGFRHQGARLSPEPDRVAEALPGATPRVCVFVHGLGCTEWAWALGAEALHGRTGVTFGTLLSDDLGFTPLYVRYNTGRHVSQNGQELSELLEALAAAYPVPIEQLVLVGHSMGGLVARSAAHYGNSGGHKWVPRLSHLFSIGSPHLGAPLEKAANALSSLLSLFDTPGTQVPARLINARSAGVKDLRYGYVVHEEWQGKDPDAFLRDERKHLPFVDGVLYAWVGSTLTEDPNHPVGQLLGDVLVRLPSAAGFAPAGAASIPFHRGSVLGGIDHLTLMNHPAVYEQLIRWLRDDRPEEVIRAELGPPLE